MEVKIQMNQLMCWQKKREPIDVELSDKTLHDIGDNYNWAYMVAVGFHLKRREENRVMGQMAVRFSWWALGIYLICQQSEVEVSY